MLKRTGKLWFLVIVCAFLSGVCGYPVFYGLASMRHTYGNVYVGRTTVAETLTLPRDPTQELTPAMQQQRLMNLGNLATCQRVLQNAATTLSYLGMKHSPEEILAATSVTPVRDTGILAIEVTLSDAKEAKVAADVIANEFKNVYQELQTAPLSIRREFYYQTWSGNAASTLTSSVNALRAYKRAHGSSPDDAELVKLEADATVAKDSYVSAKKKLTEAIVDEQRAKSEVPLRTIDPAYVRALERPNPVKLVLAALFTPLAGPIIGVIIGLVLGLAIAALAARRRLPNQGV